MEFNIVFLFACILVNVKAITSDNCGFTMYATCDDKMQFFADEKLLETSNNWRITSAVKIPANTQRIEIHCSDSWIVGGILASSENGLKTDGNWTCSSDNGYTWEPAHELAANGKAAPNISAEAMWIWTQNDTWNQYSNKTGTEYKNSAICKMSLPNNCTTPPTPSPHTPTPTATPTVKPDFTMHATCGGSCDNKMKLFADGKEMASSDDWRVTAPILIPGDTCQVEIHCQNFWAVGGILASSDTGIKTDKTWSCSSDNGTTWDTAYEIGSSGMSSLNISAQAKWIWTGKDTWAIDQNTKHSFVICKINIGSISSFTSGRCTTTSPIPDSSSSTSFTPSKFTTLSVTQTFGEWSSWSSYSPCSATCGVAAKTRKRTCLRLPCHSGDKEETIYCHLPSCGPFVEQKCFLEDSKVTFLDLGHNHMHQDQKPVWEISHKGRKLLERVNTRPSIGLSNLGSPTKPVSFSGRVTSGSNDDDVIGMVFGFWNESNFFVIASSQQHPGPTNWFVGRLHASCGPSCASTTTISDAIWDPSSHPEDITVLATGSTYWHHTKKYNFSVCFDPENLLVSVKIAAEDEVQPILDSGVISAKTNSQDIDEISRRGGFVGVFVDSQAHTTWEHLKCDDCHLKKQKVFGETSSFNTGSIAVPHGGGVGGWHRGGEGGSAGGFDKGGSVALQGSFQ